MFKETQETFANTKRDEHNGARMRKTGGYGQRRFNWTAPCTVIIMTKTSLETLFSTTQLE